MDVKTYLKISGINLAFLLLGIGIGIAVEEHRSSVVHAQEDAEYVTPVATVGSMAIGTLLSGRIATDQLTVQGVDLLKFDQNMVNYLASRPIGTTEGWSGVIADSRVSKPLRMAKPPEVQKPGAEKKPEAAPK